MSDRRNAVRNGSASDGPIAMPSASRAPSVFTATCPLGRAAWLQKPRKIAAFAQLRDYQLHRPGARFTEPLSAAVAAVQPIGTPLCVRRRAQTLRVHVHHALRGILDHLQQQNGVPALSASSASEILALAVIAMVPGSD